MRVKTIAGPLILVILAAVIVSAQGSRSAAVRQIDKYVLSVDRIVENKRNRKYVVADTAGENDKRSKWKLFPSEKALEKYREDNETYTIAFNWKSRGRIVATNFTLFSGSGDWAHYVYHYFRPDGSAAFIKCELRTFYGDYIVISDWYFDRRGKLLRKRTKYFDLTTQKPKKPTADMLADGSDVCQDMTYKKAGKLPFAKLLK